MTGTLAAHRPTLRWVPVVFLMSLLGATAAMLICPPGHSGSGAPSATAAARAAAPEFSAPAGELQVALTPATWPIPVGVMQEWSVRLNDRAGAPRGGCRLQIDGTMPDHGHGLPTAPRIGATSARGQYRLEGLRFSMPGRWLLTVSATGCPGGGDATFELSL